MNRYGINGANRCTMTTGKRVITDDNGFISPHGYRFRWTNLVAKTTADTLVSLNNR
jgi:hypothetical protein